MKQISELQDYLDNNIGLDKYSIDIEHIKPSNWKYTIGTPIITIKFKLDNISYNLGMEISITPKIGVFDNLLIALNDILNPRIQGGSK